MHASVAQGGRGATRRQSGPQRPEDAPKGLEGPQRMPRSSPKTRETSHVADLLTVKIPRVAI
eukprot:5961230-Pyramimonas_sp.AAC.1